MSDTIAHNSSTGIRTVLKHMSTVPIVGMGKRGRTLIGPWGCLNRKLPFKELTCELLALYRFSVVNAIGNAIV